VNGERSKYKKEWFDNESFWRDMYPFMFPEERFAKTDEEELPDGTKLIQLHEIFDGLSRVQNEWILIRKGRAKSFKFHHTLYSGQELKERMEQVGFADIRLFGNLNGDEYGPEAQRLIILGRKK